MATQMQQAREGRITDAMKIVAQEEHIPVETIRERVANGTIAICANVNHENLRPRGVGEGLRVKVNANIGTSSTFPDIEPELEKLDEAVRCGADAVMDLSTGNNIDISRQRIIEHSPIMVGTVPLYQATVRSIREHGAVVEMTDDDILETIEQQAKDGADFMTLHCGVTRSAIERMRRQGRIMDIVSRGGSFIAGWMLHNEMENPLYERYDDILDICEKYDVTISLGDGMRPGCTADATDRGQLTELITLGELVDRAWKRGVQVMVEGPGHVPYDQIEANMKLEKRLCRHAPFYVLGPLVTDIAPGYDHITAAIGGTLAAVSGADFLCYVTPAEHRASSRAASPPMPLTSCAACRVRANGTSRWPRRAKSSTGTARWNSPSIQSSPRRSAAPAIRLTKVLARCAATTALSRSSTSTSTKRTARVRTDLNLRYPLCSFITIYRI